MLDQVIQPFSSSTIMSRIPPPLDTAGGEPPLTALREPDVSRLALWSALFVASSTLLAFLATAPANAWPNAQPVSASAPVGLDRGTSDPEAGEVRLPEAQPTETDGGPWH